MEPAVPAESFVNVSALSSSHRFSDMSAGANIHRAVGIVRTSADTGLYELRLMDGSGDVLTTAPARLPSRASGYEFITNTEALGHSGDFRAHWLTEGRDGGEDYATDMWMLGQERRTLFSAEDLPTTQLTQLTPYGVSAGSDATPTLVVRQDGNDAATSPFVAVFEQSTGSGSTVTAVREVLDDGTAVAVAVDSSGEGGSEGRTDLVVPTTDGDAREMGEDTAFAGTCGVIATDDDGLVSLYLGHGASVSAAGAALASTDATSANLERTDDGFTVDSLASVTASLPVTSDATAARIEAK